MEKSKRDCNFELLRIVCMLMIIMHHYVVHSGFLSNATPLNELIAMAFSVGGKIGINLFIMISGYYILDSKVKMKKLLKIIFEVHFYSILIVIFLWFWQRDAISLKNIFPITYALYWFVTPYIWLYISSPYIVRFIKNLTQKEHEKLLIIMTVALAIIPTIVLRSTTIMSNFIWFVYLYILVSYIKLYGISFLEEKKKVKKYIALTYGSLILIFAISMFFVNNVEKVVTHFTSMNSIFCLILSITIFMYFKNINIKENKLILFLSTKSFAVYLLHDNPMIRKFLWIVLFKNNQKYDINSVILILDIIIVSLIVYMVGIAIEYLRTRFVESLVLNNKYVKYVESKIDLTLEGEKIWKK